MKNYNINIAGYNIGFRASASCHDLVPSTRFLRNVTDVSDPDVQISVHSGTYNIPEEAERVFHAPFVEEINGVQVHQRTNFWSIWKDGSDLFIHTIFPQSSEEKNAILKFSLTSREWELWIHCTEKETDPFEYPLDGLILYYLTVIFGDIMIHASGVNNSGQGYIFSGISGKGKSTLAMLWDTYGAKVIHDDRLIIRNTVNGYMMYNTPVYNNDAPRESPLNRIYLIEHGTSNQLIPVKDTVAISLIMANCIQHNWDTDIIERLLDSVSVMCGSIPVFRLNFTPDISVINQILENE